ncbi:MAG TPA: PD-(D/E)XK nuclease family protein [Candidatus Nanoarchaeia archaeon]|nr:PD-(D/E)XK nuclease family protein [Candidatus Nanoarchaeia archaeon]
MVKTYSNSRLSTFEQCPLKFKYRYIDKIFPEVEKTIETHLGSCVHNILEWVYNQVKEGNIPTLDDTIVYYSDIWKKDYKSSMIIVNQSLTQKDYFDKGIQFLIDYYTKHQPFQDGTIELEKEIRIALDESGEYEIVGFIDRLVKNLQTGEYEIHDYKTANSLPTQEKVDSDRQLALYAIAIKEMFNTEEVCLIWHYLAHNKKICSKRTNEQLQKLKQETLELIKKIESTTNFPSNNGKLCDWCEYKQMCPEWNTSEENVKKEPEQMDLKKYPTVSKYIKD